MGETSQPDRPYYVYDEYEEEELEEDCLIDVEMEEDFKEAAKDRCKDDFLNTLCEGYSHKFLDEQSDEENTEESENEVDEAEQEGYDADFNGVHYTTHDPKVKWKKMRPVLGERYESPHQLKNCLINYAISNGYNIRFVKCDSSRLLAKCGKLDDKKPCPFRLLASWMSQERSFQVKKLVDEHKCVRKFSNANLMSPSWLARHFVRDLILKPNTKCKDMQDVIKQKFHCKVSWSKCYRARCRAMSLIEGKLSEHYARVWDYSHELTRANPGSTVKVGVTVNPDGRNYFHRIYICFKAIKEGWKRGCRRVIGLDGSFLKGQCKGEILTAIGRDANNQVYPIAWAIVDIENKPNWKWFIELLDEDLGLQGGRGACIISDQHKGLLEATKEVLPYVDHRQCARHIYANFRKTWNGVEYRNLFWAAAASTVEGEFLRVMNELKKISVPAYEYLQAREPRTWCRAYFGSGLACEAVENGIAECFNAIILDARKKPLLTMLEEIRLYMMDRFYKMSQKEWDTNVCKAAVKKMDKFGEDLRNWQVHPSGPTLYEARNGYEAFCVDLEAHICTCRLWEISGIPCVHAQASILFSGQDPVEFISMWFSVEKFKATYATNILPVNGSNMWPTSEYTKPFPPLARRMPGRPSVKRKRHISEHSDKYHSVSGKGRAITCTNCLQKGHNKVSCKNEKVIPEPLPKKKIGRPRVEPDISHWTRGRGRGVRGGGTGSTGGVTGSFRGGTGSRGGVRGVRVGVMGSRGGGTGFRGAGTGSSRGGHTRSRGGKTASRGGGTAARGGKTASRGGGTACKGGGTACKGVNVPNAADGTEDVKGKKVAETADEFKEDFEDPIDPAGDIHHIKRQIDSLRGSNYTNEEIKIALGITDEEMEDFDKLQLPPEHEEMQLSLDFDAIEVPIEAATQEEEEMDGTQNLVAKSQKPVPKKRRPSERIMRKKLNKKVEGAGASQDVPLVV